MFDRKDMLQAGFLQQHFGLAPGAYPVHFIPASSAYLQALCLGLGYGLIPDQQLQAAFPADQPAPPLQELAPQQPVDVMLYWHAWKIQSPRLQRLGAALQQAASLRLLPP